jgi:hypothetical protein
MSGYELSRFVELSQSDSECETKRDEIKKINSIFQSSTNQLLQQSLILIRNLP